MKAKSKRILLLLLFVAALLGCAACSSDESPYKGFTKDGYGVSVRFDGNGGQFAGTSDMELVDVFPTSLFADGGVKLLVPGSDGRGKGKTRSTISRTDYVLAGWYRERNLRVDASGNPLDENGRRATLDVNGIPLYKDANGNPVDENGNRMKLDENGMPEKQYTRQGYVYANPWNFETDLLTIEAGKKYSAKDAVLTLYAAWVPHFTYDFQEKDGSGNWQSCGTYKFDPETQADKKEMAVPTWDAETGGVAYGDFPQADGKTFTALYADSACTQAITEKFAHSGYIDWEHGIAVNSINTFYTEWRAGVWFRVSTVEQFVANATIDQCLEILADLDFSDSEWPSGLARGDFSAKIMGGGHTLSNITVKQTDMNAQDYGGLFGRITSGAELNDVHFANVTYQLLRGSRKQGTGFGLLTGNMAEDATIEGVTIANSVLEIGDVYALYAAGSSRENGYDGYTIGLLSGNGVTKGITYSIVCRAANVAEEGEEARYPVKVTVDAESGAVTVEANETPAVNPN